MTGLPVPDHRPIAATAEAFYVASGSTLRRSIDGAAFDVTASFADPITDVVATDDAILVMTNAGIFRSDDEGATFVPATAGLTGQAWTLRASAADVVATSSEGDVFRWSEQVDAWRRVEANGTWMTFAVADGPTVLGDTGGGVFRSVGLGTWTPIPGLDAWGYRDLAISGLLGAAIAAHGEVRVSRNGGATFSTLSDAGQSLGLASRVVVEGGRILVATDRAVLSSDDVGRTWQKRIDAPGLDGRTRVVARGDRVMSSAERLRASTDAGSRFGATIALDDAVVTDVSSLSDRPVVSHATGAEVLSRDGTRWIPLVTRERIYRATSDEASSYVMLGFDGEPFFSPMRLARVEDDALFEVPLPTTSFSERFDVVAARHGRLLVGASTDVMVPASPHPRSSGLYRSDDLGQTWSDASDGLPTFTPIEGLGAHPGIVDLATGDDATLVLLAGNVPYRAADFGGAWVAAADGLGDVTSVRLDRLTPTDHGMVASSRIGGVGLHRFDARSARWERLDAAGLPIGFETLAVTSAPGALYVATRASGESAPTLYVSFDDGATFAAIRRDVRVSSMRVVGDALYVGTSGEGMLKLAPASCARP